MTSNNVLADKTIAFSIRMVNCYQYLMEEKKEFIMSKQLFRSGTSVGANVHEGIQAQSKSDFISKLGIALKEASESSYWLVVLFRSEKIDEKIYSSLKKDIDEIIRILVSTIKTAKHNINTKHENEK
ncbi:MAG: four helix bundle protein [Prevotella sp.]|nr:four helix bundle protein [Prevotella sp.]